MDSSSGNVAVLAFELAGGQLALVAQQVREVVSAVAITRLPHAPEVIEGVINFRGEIVPVLDIRRRFALPSLAPHPAQHLIIARAGGRTVALRVDRAVDLHLIAREAISTGAVDLPGVEHVTGVAALPEGALVIHDLERFLGWEEARQLSASLDQLEPS